MHGRSIQFCKIQGIFWGKDFQNLGEEIEILGKIITPGGPERAPLQIPLMICCQLTNMIPSIIVNMSKKEKAVPITEAASRLVLQQQGILQNLKHK